MKKKSIFFAILGSCFGLGIILIVIGTILGGRIHGLSIESQKNKKGVSTELSDISLSDNTDIQKLDLDLSASSIKICRGNLFSIKGDYLSKNEVSDGTWTVESNLSDHFYTINVFGIAHIPIPFHHNDNTMDDITITIPYNVSLKEADMELNAADVTIDELDSNKIDLEVSAGSIDIDSITAREADFSVSAGDITIKQYNISESASLDCSLGDIQFGTRKYAKTNICSNLEADCSIGDISTYGKLTGKNYLDCSMGNIDMYLIGSQVNYNIESTDTSLGDINYRTKNFLEHSGGSGNISPASDSETYGSLNFSCSMGNIDICYLYSTPEN